MRSLIRPLQLAFKSWWRQPVITIAVLLCLGVGTGITAVVFSLIDGILIRPLPYHDPDGIYVLWNRFAANGGAFSQVSGWEFLDFREQTQTFEEIGGLITWSYNLTSTEPPERVISGRVSASLFRVLGVEPARGRVFTEREEEHGDRVVVLSHALWQRAFGGAPDILGRSLSLDRRPYTIIGVLPPELRMLPRFAELWVPLVPDPKVPRDLRGVLLLARLRDGVDAERAKSDLEVLEDRFRRDHPHLYPSGSGWELVLQPLQEAFVGPVRGRLWLSFGAALLVLLLACTNIVNLLLVRALSRRGEYALRTALGADRGGLLRHLLGEYLLLALAGGALGWWLAKIGLRLTIALQPGDLPRLGEVAVDARIVVLIFALTLVTGLIFGLYPVWRIAGQSLHAPLNENVRTAGRGHPFFRWIVIGELTVAMVVLVGTGLMWRSFERLQDVDPGFRTTDLLTMTFLLPRGDYRDDTDRLRFYERFESRLVERFGKERVGLISQVPLGPHWLGGPVLAEDQQNLPHLEQPEIGWRAINPTFFQTMGIALRQGRPFDARDRRDAPPTVIVDRRVAQRLWPGKDPLGRRLRLAAGHDIRWRTVVGVVEPIKQRKLAADPFEQIYLPYEQHPQERIGVVLKRNGSDVASALGEVREIMRQIDPHLPLANVQTIEELIERSLSGPRFLLTLFAAFGVVTLVLTTAGVYGVIAHTTARRTGEIGLRQALGARRRDILWLILGEGLSIGVIGIIAGLALALLCALAFAGILAGMAFGVTSTNPSPFVGGALLLLGLTLLATLLPALRAARLDPAAALQRE